MSLAIIVGMSLVTFFLLFTMFKLREDKDDRGVNKYQVVTLLLLFFVASSLLGIGEVVRSSSADCDFAINSTTVVGNVTSYTYAEQCVVTSPNTTTSFYNGLLILVGILYFYVFVAFFYKVLLYFGVIRTNE